VSNFGTYNPTLQLNFAQIWLPWTTVDQPTIFTSFHSETLANNWNAEGSIQRTVRPENRWRSSWR
jgi:hypothetical protein